MDLEVQNTYSLNLSLVVQAGLYSVSDPSETYTCVFSGSTYFSLSLGYVYCLL